MLIVIKLLEFHVCTLSMSLVKEIDPGHRLVFMNTFNLLVRPDIFPFVIFVRYLMTAFSLNRDSFKIKEPSSVKAELCVL